MEKRQERADGGEVVDVRVQEGKLGKRGTEWEEKERGQSLKSSGSSRSDGHRDAG